MPSRAFASRLKLLSIFRQKDFLIQGSRPVFAFCSSSGSCLSIHWRESCSYHRKWMQCPHHNFQYSIGFFLSQIRPSCTEHTVRQNAQSPLHQPSLDVCGSLLELRPFTQMSNWTFGNSSSLPPGLRTNTYTVDRVRLSRQLTISNAFITNGFLNLRVPGG